MNYDEEVKSLQEAADVGAGYAKRLIEWFGSASAAIDYLCAPYAEQGKLLDRALRRMK